MKFSMFGALMAFQLLSSLPHAVCQENKGVERKHVLVTGPGGGGVAAVDIQRKASYPSVIHLKGNVEIRRAGMILHADEADYDEKTGEIEARGHVRIKPYPAFPAPANKQSNP